MCLKLGDWKTLCLEPDAREAEWHVDGDHAVNRSDKSREKSRCESKGAVDIGLHIQVGP